MSKLFAAVSTLTTLAVLATSATGFASDHRHGARAPAAISPAPAAARAAPPKVLAATNPAAAGERKAGVKPYHPKHRRPGDGAQNSPRSGGPNQEK